MGNTKRIFMKHFKFLFLVLIAFTLSTTVSSCTDDTNEPSNSIVGTWRLTLNGWNCQYNFKSTGTFEVKDWNTNSGEPTEYEADGTYKINNSNNIIILNFNDEVSPYSEHYIFTIKDNTLIIYDYEEEGPNIFRRI